MTTALFVARDRRRSALLSLARTIARRARRERHQDVLDRVRSIGAQLDALDPASPAASDVLDAAFNQLIRNSEAIDQ